MNDDQPDPIEERVLRVLYVARNDVDHPNLRVNTILLRDPMRPRIAAAEYEDALYRLEAAALVMHGPVSEVLRTWQITKAGAAIARQLFDDLAAADLASRTEPPPHTDLRGDPLELPAGAVVMAHIGSSAAAYVKSRTTAGAWWLVVGDRCSCPAEVSPCWHVRRTFEYAREISEPRPRAADTGEAVTARFVD